MKPEEIVPTFKTCAGIPQGAFEHSAMVWCTFCGETLVQFREGVIAEAVLCPAPTLEEIIKGELKLVVQPYCGGEDKTRHDVTGLAVMMGQVRDDLTGSRRYLMEVCEYADLAKPDFDKTSRTAAEAALRAWLRMRGGKKPADGTQDGPISEEAQNENAK